MQYTHIVREDFSSLNQLMLALKTRPDNKIMQGKKSSQRTTDPKFFGTANYEEASRMLTDGYIEILGQLKDTVKEKRSINSKFAESIPHQVPHTAMVGYSPCVPNAILGLPNSMISIDKKPIKRKTLSIVYAMGANCGTNAKYFSEAGAALLSAIDLIERSGIQTQLKLCFYPSEEDGELACATVVIKNYGERYSLQKISFPLAHPSMFRRIGFKWLETSPDITKSGFNFGYGHTPNWRNLEEAMEVGPNTCFIDIDFIHNNNCDAQEILKKFGVI